MAGDLIPYSDDMDVSDDDGGVPLDLSSRPNLDPAIGTPKLQIEQGGSHEAPSEPAPRNAYFQDPAIFLVPGTQLWRIPEVRRPGSEHTRNDGKDSMPAHIFEKSCKLIQQHWGCKPAIAVPDMLLESTPYSLALLLQLRMLASYSKKDRMNAHAILTNEWESRMKLLELGGQHFEFGMRVLQTTMPAHVDGMANPLHTPHCESQIQENVFGLTLQDVVQAIAVVKDGIRRQKDPEARELKKRERLLRRAQCGTPTRNSRSSTKQTTANSAPALTLQDMIRAGAGSEGAHLTNFQTYNARPDDTQGPGDGDTAYHVFTKQDRKAYNAMTWMMESKLRVQDGRGRTRPSEKQQNKKEKTLKFLAESGGRNGSGLATLPSERVDFSSLPALHAQLGNIKEQEVAEAMGALQLAQLGQEPLPRLPEARSHNISKDDNAWFRQ